LGSTENIAAKEEVEKAKAESLERAEAQGVEIALEAHTERFLTV
jgi:hypothetical protein